MTISIVVLYDGKPRVIKYQADESEAAEMCREAQQMCDEGLALRWSIY